MPRNPFQRMVFAFVSRHLFIQPLVRRIFKLLFRKDIQSKEKEWS